MARFGEMPLVGAGLAAILGLGGNAFAQEEPAPAAAPADAVAGEGTRYTPANFTRFAPRTALDMVEKVPGFQLVSGSNGGNRGLGGATDNLLINGERIANKTTDARSALQRIPAEQVAYIAIVDGASLSVPGLTGQVANVVLVEGAGQGFTTSFQWRPEWRPGLKNNWLDGEISTSGAVGGAQTTLSLTNEARRQGHWGPEYVYDSAGDLVFVRQEKGQYDTDRPRLSLALTDTASNGNIWNFNLGGQLVDRLNRIDGQSVQPDFGAVKEAFRFTEEEHNYDVGGDYEFSLGKGRLKLIGLYRFEHSPTVDQFIIDREVGGRSGLRFSRDADESEAILRGEYGWRTAGGSDWQVALEGAYNSLEVDAELAELDADGVFRPVNFGGEHTRVEEKRAEASLSWGRALADNLTAQINLGTEYSELSSSGPGGLTRQFLRPKGKIALAWKAAEATTVNWLLQRRVDQLDFFDFASSVDLENDKGNRGNGRLVPPIINRTELEIVQDMGRWGNASFAFAYAYAENLVDQIPLSDSSEGRGNLSPAHLYRISSKATLLLDPLGWAGARIDSDITVRRNRVRDPLTDIWRDQSMGQEYDVAIKLRHDIAGSDIAWGTNFSDNRLSPRVRLDAIEREYSVGPFVTAYVEHKDVAGLRLRLSYHNLAKMEDGFDRTVYVDRRDGPIAFSESRQRGFGRFFQITVSGTI
ncbi:TonB-dependent receptor plug domain-containing protein [Sphingopyxis sp. MWB1]|uniref:TonB-dependent receptor plug domain-containing protein n=1 Tax=Sphingopyxis sp. MWB1 TaxID=1537715 RepID=UPI00051A8A77|nr:TonB-dependent receptor plug domain-containing protein [Sphingopyxis sp. MWB1]